MYHKKRAKEGSKEGKKFKDCSTFLVPIIDFLFIYPHTNTFRTRMIKTERRPASRIRTSISRQNRSGFLANKCKKAGSRKANRKANRKDTKIHLKQLIIMSKHATQRYRERGPNTFPVIKAGNGDYPTTAVTLLPMELAYRTKRYKSAKKAKMYVLPFWRHGHNVSKEFILARVPKEIKWIFSISKQM